MSLLHQVDCTTGDINKKTVGRHEINTTLQGYDQCVNMISIKQKIEDSYSIASRQTQMATNVSNTDRFCVIL